MNGLYFRHDHPTVAMIWGIDDVVRIVNRRDVRTVVGDMCRFEHEDRGRMIDVERQGEDEVHDKCTQDCRQAPSVVPGMTRSLAYGRRQHD